MERILKVLIISSFLFVPFLGKSQDTTKTKTDSVKNVSIKVPMKYRVDTSYFKILYVDSPNVKIAKARVIVKGYGSEQLNGFFDNPTTVIYIGEKYNKELKQEDVLSLLKKY